MADEEIIMREMENQFPPLSGVAFDTARKQTLDSGLSVMQSEGGEIYEVSPDGVRKFVKRIEPPTPVELGLKINIR
jgi:hypothetical protein